MSLQQLSQNNLRFNSNFKLSTEVEIKKYLNHLSNKLDDYHKSYYKDSDNRQKIYVIHEKINKNEKLDNIDTKVYLEHLFEHNNEHRKEQMSVLNSAIETYSGLKNIRELSAEEDKEVNYFVNRLTRIQSDFKIFAKCADWLSSRIDNMKNFDIVKEHVLEYSDNPEYAENLINTIEKIQSKKIDKSKLSIKDKENKITSDNQSKQITEKDFKSNNAYEKFENNHRDELESLKAKAKQNLKSLELSPEELKKNNADKSVHGRLKPPHTPNIRKGEQSNNKGL